jgi:hypothetical protein
VDASLFDRRKDRLGVQIGDVIIVAGLGLLLYKSASSRINFVLRCTSGALGRFN